MAGFGTPGKRRQGRGLEEHEIGDPDLESGKPKVTPAERAAARQRMRLAAGGVAALIFLAWMLWPAGSDETQVRAVLDAVEESAEEREIGGVLEHISPTYKDKDGLTKDMLRALLLREVFGRRSIAVQRFGSTEVAVRKDRSAMATFRATFAEGLGGGRESYDFEVMLRKEEDGEWRIVSHARTRAP